MKIAVLLLLALLLIGCVENKTQVITPQTLQGNSIGFTWATVNISDSFLYEGVVASEYVTGYRESMKTVDMTTERHLFVDKSCPKDSLSKGIIVIVERPKDPKAHFVTEASYSDFKGGFIDRGTTKCGDMDVAFMTQRVTKFADDVKDYLKSKGYTLTNKGTVYSAQFAKVAGHSTRVIVQYYEANAKSEQIVAQAKKVISFTR